MFMNLAIKAVYYEMSHCRDTPFTSLAASVPKSGHTKACLTWEETLHDLTCHATVHRHIKTADVNHYANAKIPEILVGFFRPEYSGYRLEEIQLFRSTRICWLFHFWQTGSSLPYFFSLMQGHRKRNKNHHSWLARFHRIPFSSGGRTRM